MRPIAFATALLLSISAGANPTGPLKKKLIQYGWGVPDPEFVRDHIREMEKRPFDGVIFRLRDFNHAFDTRRWERDKLQPQLEALGAIQWKTFTDNFLCLYSANRWEMDWFDDDQWRNIEANLRLTAEAAARGRCVGVCFDPEPYGNDPWLYASAGGRHTAAELAQQVRRRGAQFIRALQGPLPRLRLLTLFQCSVLGSVFRERDPARRQQILQSHHYGLLPAFLDGMLDAAGPGVQIIDGNEGSYYYQSDDSYYHAHHLMTQGALELISRENHDAYHLHVRAGMAVYMDQVLALRPPPTAFLSYHLTPEQRARWLEHNVYWSLRTTDEYVWCYNERLDWWGTQTSNKSRSVIPPGAEEAMRSARTKAADRAPLGFDIEPYLSAAREKMQAAIASRLIKREADIHHLQQNEAAPVIDGVLDDPAWKQHAPLERLLPTAGSGLKATAAATTAWVVWDDAKLYVAFRCQEPLVRRMEIVGERRDDEVWRGDVVELFVSQGSQTRPYRHFIVNPRNLQWDGASDGAGDNVAWNARWQSAARVGKDEWTVEMAVPWEVLGGAPQPGQRRRANLCRQRRPGRELSSWSVVLRGFVEPGRFGVWRFVR